MTQRPTLTDLITSCFRSYLQFRIRRLLLLGSDEPACGCLLQDFSDR